MDCLQAAMWIVFGIAVVLALFCFTMAVITAV